MLPAFVMMWKTQNRPLSVTGWANKQKLPKQVHVKTVTSPCSMSPGPPLIPCFLGTLLQEVLKGHAPSNWLLWHSPPLHETTPSVIMMDHLHSQLCCSGCQHSTSSAGSDTIRCCHCSHLLRVSRWIGFDLNICFWQIALIKRAAYSVAIP